MTEFCKCGSLKIAAKASPGEDVWDVTENRAARVEKIRRKRG